jgi:hypothetical protein
MNPRSSTGIEAADRGRYWPLRYASTAWTAGGGFEWKVIVAAEDVTGWDVATRATYCD